MGGQLIEPIGSADLIENLAEELDLRPALTGLAKGSADVGPLDSGILVIVEPRDFLRGCMAHWLENSCARFAIMAVPTFDASSQGEQEHLARAVAALIGVSWAQNGDDWAADQVTNLRSECAKLPMVLIVEPDDASRADALARRLNIQGYIPTSNTVAVAAAALRLVIAGGLYFPGARDGSLKKVTAEVGAANLINHSSTSARLTPREEAVLGVLASGAQNKIIAYQLNMSLSTVKAHVHSIIQKLKVRNRTEVVVAARNMFAQEDEDHPAVSKASFGDAVQQRSTVIQKQPLH